MRRPMPQCFVNTNFLLFIYVIHAVHLVSKNTFQCAFYEIPAATYHPDKLPHEALTLHDSNIRVHHGTLSVDFAPALVQMGSFKTSHPGKVNLDNNSKLLPFTNDKVCVKQMYERKGDGGNSAISRLRGNVELDALLVECNCARWASILMDLTYQFVAREVNTRGDLPYPIPKLRFTRVMIAVVQNLPAPKAFLVEEWINMDDRNNRFTKYLNNRVPHHTPDLVSQAPKAREITEFLIFAQHVQWKKTQHLAFTADYQGAGDVLTDPQIMSNPYASLAPLYLVHCTDVLPAYLAVYLVTETYQVLLKSSVAITAAINTAIFLI
jgi:hypothetical protein